MELVSILTDVTMAERVASKGRPRRPVPPYPLTFPASLIERAAQYLAENGRQELEQVVLWGGYSTARGVVLASLLLPATEATWGWVHVIPSEQPKIAEWLRDHGQLLFAEAHTHGLGPRATELSDEDRRHPAGRQNGFLTIIVPDYARAGILLPRAGVWECRELAWTKLSRQDVRARLRVVADEEARHELA